MKKIRLLFLFIFLGAVFVFADTDLGEALLKSKAGSLEFRQIVIDRDVQNKALLQALPSILPYVNYTLSADSTDMTNWSYNQSLGISQKLFDIPVFISLYKNKEYADIANAIYIKGVHNLTQSVIDQYFLLLEYQVRMDIDTLLIRREEENVKKGDVLQNSGFISETDFLILNSNYFNVAYSYKVNQSAYDAALIDFTTLTGIENPGRLLDVNEIPVFGDLTFEEEDILKNIPEYVISAKTYSAAVADEVSSYSEFFPKATFNMSYGLSDSLLDIDFSRFGSDASFRAGVSVTFPVFTGFSRTLNVIDKSYARKSSNIDFLKTKQVLLLELKNLGSRVSWTKDLYESAEKSFEASKKVFEKSQRLYSAGEVSTADYITYQKNYLESAINLIKAKKEMYKLYYRYMYLLRRKP